MKMHQAVVIGLNSTVHYCLLRLYYLRIRDCPVRKPRSTEVSIVIYSQSAKLEIFKHLPGEHLHPIVSEVAAIEW